MTDIDDVSMAALFASDVIFVNEEIIDGEIDEGFRVSRFPDESTESHPERRVRYVPPKSDGGTMDRIVFTVTRVGLGLRSPLTTFDLGFKVTVAEEMIEFLLLPTMIDGGITEGTVTRDGSIDNEGMESLSDSLKSVVVTDPEVAVESDFLEDLPLLKLLLLLIYLGDLDFLENIFFSKFGQVDFLFL